MSAPLTPEQVADGVPAALVEKAAHAISPLRTGPADRQIARAVLAAVLPDALADERREALHEHVSEMEAYSLGVVRGRRDAAKEIAAAIEDTLPVRTWPQPQRKAYFLARDDAASIARDAAHPRSP